MDAIDVTALAEHFNDRILQIQTCRKLTDGLDDETLQILGTVQADLLAMKSSLQLCREQIRKGHQDLKNAQSILETMKILKKRYDYTLQNIPVRLPSNTPVMAVEVAVSVQEMQNQEDMNPKKLEAEFQSGESSENHPAVPRKLKPKKPIPSLQILTLDEYNSVPKYMKGRITYDVINTVIEAFNKTLQLKYQLLAKPLSSRSEKEKKKWKEFKAQESKDTKGVYFCVFEDLKESSNLKMDPTGRNILTIMRHCGRIREIRGPGSIVRYGVSQTNFPWTQSETV